MNRRGMALLLVLWLLVALSSLAGVTLAGARVGNQTSRNRLALTRAGWAADGCLAILRSRYPASVAGIDSVDLGQEIWCSARVSDPGNRLNVNLASREMLVGFTGDSALADSIIGQRQFQADGETDGRRPSGPWERLAATRPRGNGGQGGSLESFTTIRGDGRINLNTAPEPVLRVVPGLGEEGARQLVTARNGRAPFRSPEEVVSVLPAAARERVMSRYAEFVAATTLSPSQLVAELEGHVGSSPLVSRATITMVPAGARLAVIRQEVE